MLSRFFQYAFLDGRLVGSETPSPSRTRPVFDLLHGQNGMNVLLT